MDESGAAYNKQFGKSTAEVVNSTFLLLSTLVLNLSFSISKPCLRQAANRYRQAVFRCTKGLLSYCTFPH